MVSRVKILSSFRTYIWIIYVVLRKKENLDKKIQKKKGKGALNKLCQSLLWCGKWVGVMCVSLSSPHKRSKGITGTTRLPLKNELLLLKIFSMYLKIYR